MPLPVSATKPMKPSEREFSIFHVGLCFECAVGLKKPTNEGIASSREKNLKSLKVGNILQNFKSRCALSESSR
jgi:hypothetical protein